MRRYTACPRKLFRDKATFIHRLCYNGRFLNLVCQVWKSMHQGGRDVNVFEQKLGAPGWLSGWASVLAQVRILGFWDPVLHQVPCRKPTSPSAYVSASLCLSWINRILKKKKEQKLNRNTSSRIGDNEMGSISDNLNLLTKYWYSMSTGM